MEVWGKEQHAKAQRQGCELLANPMGAELVSSAFTVAEEQKGISRETGESKVGRHPAWPSTQGFTQCVSGSCFVYESCHFGRKGEQEKVKGH